MVITVRAKRVKASLKQDKLMSGAYLFTVKNPAITKINEPLEYVGGMHLYTWVKRGNVKQSSLSKETTLGMHLRSK